MATELSTGQRQGILLGPGLQADKPATGGSLQGGCSSGHVPWTRGLLGPCTTRRPPNDKNQIRSDVGTHGAVCNGAVKIKALICCPRPRTSHTDVMFPILGRWADKILQVKIIQEDVAPCRSIDATCSSSAPLPPNFNVDVQYFVRSHRGLLSQSTLKYGAWGWRSLFETALDSARGCI